MIFGLAFGKRTLLGGRTMKTLAIVLVACIGMVSMTLWAGADAEPAGSRIDLSKPETWKAAVAREKEDLKEVAGALISVAKDEKRPGKERFDAIQLLGEIGNEKSLEFLIENVGMFVEGVRMYSVSDKGMLQNRACYYALRQGDWRVPQAILRCLDRTWSDGELIWFYDILKNTIGNQVALAIVNYELSQGPRAVHRKNLITLREYLTSS